MGINITKLDKIYSRYGYEIKKTERNVRIYILRQGMYYGAEIIPLTHDLDMNSIKIGMSDAGYSCIVRKYNSEAEAEAKLFEGFFNTRLTAQKINRKYRNFTDKQKTEKNEKNYEYINPPYKKDNLSQNLKSTNIVDDVIKILDEKGPYFIIIEAAASFGKTCTAYEILNGIAKNKPSKVPLFSELSRNRQAKIFKYVLLSEIEEEFHSMLNSNLVKYHIQSGKIPLIIDGFDELLSKEQVKQIAKSNDFEQVETMLSTIGDFLQNNAKIILTSRKTAIFSGLEFGKWIDKFQSQFKVIRFTIEEPYITDWLDKDKIDILEETKMAFHHLANPVLLSYLRKLSFKKFKTLLKKPDLIVETYFTSLLKREQERQNLKLSTDEQIEIFKKLAAIFIELNITSEEKNFVKDIIIEYNFELLNNCRSRYPAISKPSLDELANTLTNHALLDRVNSKGNNISFINDFIFGILTGRLLLEKTICAKNIPENIAEITVSSFRSQSKKIKEQLWGLFLEHFDNFSQQFKLIADLNLKDFVYGDYIGVCFEDIVFENINFDSACSFVRSIFNECKFFNCFFDLNSFKATSFTSCNFYNCNITTELDKNYSEAVLTYGCNDFGNDFLVNFDIHISDEELFGENKMDYEKEILQKFFMVDGRTTRINQISFLKETFDTHEQKKILKIIHNFTIKKILVLNGDNALLTSEGISYFNKKYKQKKELK